MKLLKVLETKELTNSLDWMPKFIEPLTVKLHVDYRKRYEDSHGPQVSTRSRLNLHDAKYLRNLLIRLNFIIAVSEFLVHDRRTCSRRQSFHDSSTGSMKNWDTIVSSELLLHL